MNIIFGTDGWRGLLESEINEQSVALVAQAFSDYAKNNFPSPRIAVAFDGRKYSQRFAEIFAYVLQGNNIQAILSDRIIPTPVLSYYVKAKNLHYGVMITASHNPPEYNGIKFKASYGGPFFTEETHKIEQLIGKSPVAESDKAIQPYNLLEVYENHLHEIVNFNAISKSNISVAIDSMSGAGTTILENILRKHGIEAKTIFGIPNENFSGRLAEPIEKNLLPLSNELKQHTFSLGVATDGDADRLGVMLDDGSWLSSQETILLLADFIKNSKKISGDIIKTSSVTNLLNANFATPKCTVHDVQVGFKYICETMLKTDAAFGAEESGGFGIKGHIPERDGILSALIFIEMLATSNHKKLSAYVEAKRKEFGTIFYDRIDLPYHANDRTEKLPTLAKNPPLKIADYSITQCSLFYSSRGIVNGLKFILEGKSRWLLLRSSETEPLIRIYAEGESTDDVYNILSNGKELIIQK